MLQTPRKALLPAARQLFFFCHSCGNNAIALAGRCMSLSSFKNVKFQDDTRKIINS